MGIGTAILASLWLAAAPEGAGKFELEGILSPPARAVVTLFGVTRPFTDSTATGERGRFRFHELAAGSYTVAVLVQGRGEARQTIDLGPSLADAKGVVRVTLHFEDSQFIGDPRGGTVSTRELGIPEGARRAYNEARKLLSRHDVEGAVQRLKRAVEIAPRFAAAWNELGTIAYQTRDYAGAERHFRRSLAEDPAAFEPLVNLGGVLLTELKLEEALRFNLYAVLERPGDALANSQLGMSYFAAGNLDLAGKYLLTAKRLDPGHFSYPQLTLAEIYLRRNQPGRAADEMEDFLRRHPDWPGAAKMRSAIAGLRKH